MDYKELKKRVKQLKTLARKAHQAVKEFETALVEFYNAMRWEKTETNHFQYEELYDEGHIYNIEETELLDELADVRTAIDQVYGVEQS